MRTCPECTESLKHERLHGVDLDRCEACVAYWFDHGELEQYWREAHPGKGALPAVSAQFQADADTTGLRCPGCGADTLLVRKVGAFTGGPCTSCSGVWLRTAPRLRAGAGAEQGISGLGTAGDVLAGGLVELAVEVALGLFDGL